MTEDQLQAKCYQHAYNTYPQIKQLLFSVPNGGTRNMVEAMKLKATGLTPGIPDMLLLHGGTCIGLEFKTDVGVLSPAQVKVHAIWRSVGYRVEVVRSFEQFCDIIDHLFS